MSSAFQQKLFLIAFQCNSSSSMQIEQSIFSTFSCIEAWSGLEWPLLGLYVAFDDISGILKGF